MFGGTKTRRALLLISGGAVVALFISFAVVAWVTQRGNHDVTPGAPPLDLEEPLPLGVTVESEAAAEAALAFASLHPSESLGKPDKTWISDPARVELADRVVAWVYHHPTYEDFTIIQNAIPISPEEFVATLEHCLPPNCQGKSVTFEDGTVALLMNRHDGLRVLTWVQANVRTVVVGPSSHPE